MSLGVLYISYDGILEPLGQSQVLAYLEKLAVGRSIHLLSFEKREDWMNVGMRRAVEARIASSGITWHARRYHKRPSALATAWDILVGTLSALWLVTRHRLGIVHARSDVPALMAWVSKVFTGTQFLFDMRGFWADERVDGGLWPAGGRLYRIAKWLEQRLLLSADHVVSLTHAAVREMEKLPFLAGSMPPVTVIPTCADMSRFVPSEERHPGLVLGYVGSVGTWYLFDAVVASFTQLLVLRPEARLLVLNRSEHAYIRDRLLAGGVDLASVEVRAAEHAEVPAQMARMHAGVFFIKPVFSKKASAPTKLAEFLGCGIPCLANSGVGDMEEILRSERVGVAVDQFDAASLHAGFQELLALVDETDIQARCVAAARKHFRLEEGAARYAAIYQMFDEASA